jgi:hypothetical protein
MGVNVTDAGESIVIAGQDQDEVRAVLADHQARGFVKLADPVRVGARYMVSCAKPESGARAIAGAPPALPTCSIERVGLSVIVRGPTEAAVLEALRNLATGGARLVAAPECLRGEWTAVCDAPR